MFIVFFEDIFRSTIIYSFMRFSCYPSIFCWYMNRDFLFSCICMYMFQTIRVFGPYAYGPDRKSILVRSDHTSWTIRVLRPYGLLTIQTLYHKLLLCFRNYIYHNYYYFKQNTITS